MHPGIHASADIVVPDSGRRLGHPGAIRGEMIFQQESQSEATIR